MKALSFPFWPKRLLAGAACVLAFASALAQDVAFLSNGLVGFYRLDGDASDVSPAHSDGVATALAFQTNRFGFAGAAGSFDGVVSRVRVPATVDFNLLPVTATAWVRLGANAGEDLSIVSTYFTASGNGWGIFVNGNKARTWYYGQQGSVPESFLVAPEPINAPKWFHLAATYDSTGGRLYVDGQLVVSHGWTGTPSRSTSQQGLILGEMLAADGTHHNFRGQIDDVRIYNRALSDGEISNLYQIEADPLRRAHAVVSTVNGKVVDVALDDEGQGYPEPPVVEIIGNGTGARAVATVAFGRVTGIQVLDAGTGYTGSVAVRIAPPPLTPTLSIAVRTVRLTLNVVEGRRYVVESSKDLNEWLPQEEFVADADTTTRDFNATEVGQYFRIREVL